ncbi:checkpoint kinase [Podospora appendiculata]|uniref:Checkpoint kinase n=1 Tax=Podospora appendiculata TaxID=314037 RepID=A0AAE1CGC2_9PEZI|nr:checkpoint kinase [Podospora appendiculata]
MDTDDNNVVTYIYPAVGTSGYGDAVLCIERNEKSPMYLPPRRYRFRAREEAKSGSPDICARSEREPTAEEEIEEGGRQLHDHLDYEACLRITFDCTPKTCHGVRAGRGKDAELYLPGRLKVSTYHFALTFDANYHLIVRDLGSKSGTAVIYDDMERGRCRNFDWIVGGSDFLQKVTSIVVKLSDDLQFRLVVPQHDINSKSYRDKVDRFRAGTTDTEQVLDLGRIGPLSQISTIGPSGAQTPASGTGKPVTVYKELGVGGFGVVSHIWDVSTGEQYALKQPRKDSGHGAQWEREIVIMKRISHKHIVALLDSCLSPLPRLHLEYMPEGSISDHLHAGRPFSGDECNQIIVQASDALTYLHSQDPQIVHRDIKPSNILMLYRRPGDLFIKFADFGLSREGDTLKTICGTYAYMAPEVYLSIGRRGRATYTALVDVWSLGVVLVRLLCGLPKQDAEDDSIGVEWCHSIREKVKGALLQGRRRRQDLLSLVLNSMLCLDPDDRKTAAECHKGALRLLELDDDDDDDGAPESSPGEAGKQDYSGGLDTDIKASTIVAREADEGLSSLSRYINVMNEPERRHGRSYGAPSPETAIPLHVGQVLQGLRDPEDSLFCRSSFGETLNSDDSNETASTIVRARGATEPRNQLGSGPLVLARESEGPQEDSPSDAPIREALLKALGDSNRATILSGKRSMAARSPGSGSPRALPGGGMDASGVGDGLRARTAKRNRQTHDECS